MAWTIVPLTFSVVLTQVIFKCQQKNNHYLGYVDLGPSLKLTPILQHEGGALSATASIV